MDISEIFDITFVSEIFYFLQKWFLLQLERHSTKRSSVRHVLALGLTVFIELNICHSDRHYKVLRSSTKLFISATTNCFTSCGWQCYKCARTEQHIPTDRELETLRPTLGDLPLSRSLPLLAQFLPVYHKHVLSPSHLI